MDFERDLIQTADIADDDTYRITTRRSIDPLTGSISAVGLLNPPFLIEKAEAWHIVAGFRRIEACRRMGWRKIGAFLIPRAAEPRIPAQIAIADNAFARSLNVVELSRAYHLLRKTVDDPDEFLQTAGMLNLPAGREYVEKIFWIRELVGELQSALLSETISLPTALALRHRTPVEQQAWAAMFNRLPLSLNRQREIMSLVDEIARREQRPELEILRTEVLQQMPAEDRRDPPQQARAILAYLKERRYPEKTKAEKRFAAKQAELKLDRGIRLTPPKDFENGVFGLQFSFESTDQLQRQLERLDALVRKEDFKKLIAADFLFDFSPSRDKS